MYQLIALPKSRMEILSYVHDVNAKRTTEAERWNSVYHK